MLTSYAQAPALSVVYGCTANASDVPIYLQPPFWSAVMALCALLIAYAVARFSIRNKQLDFVLYDHKQFDDLQKKRCELLILKAKVATDPTNAEIAKQLEIEARMFYDRFWSLQFDGFVAWCDGYLPTSLFVYWLFSRWREFQSPSDDWKLGSLTMETAFEDVTDRWHKSPDTNSAQSRQVNRFIGLMSELQTKRATNIRKLLAEHGPPRWLRLLRRPFGAY